jgi:hypothetical protein
VAEALQVILQDDPAAVLQSPNDEEFATAQAGRSMGKRNERPIGY